MVKDEVNVLLRFDLPKNMTRFKSLNIHCDNTDILVIVSSKRFGDAYLRNKSGKKFVMINSAKMAIRRK